MKALLFDGAMRRNTGLKLASEVISRLASFPLAVLAARVLGSTGFGYYNYGRAVGLVLSPLADLGMHLILTREIAIHDMKMRYGLRAALVWKAWLSLPVVAILGLAVLGQPPAFRASLFLLGLALLVQMYLDLAVHVFRGQSQLQHEAVLLAGSRLLTAGLGALALWLGWGLPGLAVTGVVAVVLVSGLAYRMLHRRGWLAPLPGRNAAQDRRWLLGQSLPLGLAIFLSIAYTRLAVLLLQARLGPEAVGQFSAASRLVEPAQIVPASLLAAVFPAYSLRRQVQPRQARVLAGITTGWLILAGSAVALGFWLLAPWLMRLFGPEYMESVPTLRLLGLSMLPAFVNNSLTHYLVARGQQALISLFNALMLLSHAAISWFLIPRAGAVGPAYGILVAELLLTLCCILALGLTSPRPASAAALPS